MCTDCNEITIPTGADGAPGAAGAPGVKGDTGAPGPNGQNGVAILTSYNNLTGVGTDADLLEKTLFSYTLNANELDTNNDELEVYIYYTYTANDNTTLRVKLGVNIITIPVSNTENTFNFLKIKISRISSTSQLWTIEQSTLNGLGAMSIGYMNVDTSTLDLTLSQAFEVTGQNDVSAAANQLVLKKCSLYKYNA